MSSAGSSSGGKAGSVIVVLAVLVVAFLAYNKICDECIFAFPEKGGGESGQSVIIAPGGAAPPPTGGFDWGALVVPFILLALLGGGIWHFGMKWADRRAGRRMRPLPVPAPQPAPTPAPVVPFDAVPPENWGDAIEKLAESHADAVLIEGRAAQTILEQGALLQKRGPRESWGALFGNFNAKSRNAVIVFSIPLPAVTSDHKSVSPDWDLIRDIQSIAINEFALSKRTVAVDLINDLGKKFRKFKEGHPPNEIIEQMFVPGVFNALTKKRLEKIGYYLSGFQKGDVFAVGWYHNHPYNPGYNKDWLMEPSELGGDTGCQCIFQQNWKSNHPVSALVAAEVLDKDASAKIGGIPLGFKFWKATGCAKQAGHLVAGGTVDLKYLIFCMDDKTYAWYREFAPKLIEKGVVLDWYAEYYEKYVKPDRKAKKVPMSEYKSGKSKSSVQKKPKKENEEHLTRGKFE